MDQTRPEDPPPTEETYRRLIDAIDDYAIFMLDADGRVSSWNPGAARFKGYTAEEILGEHFSRFYTEEDRANGVPEQVLQTAAAEGRFEGQGWRVRKDGSRFWAHVVIDVIRDPSNAPSGYAKITRDLTEQREIQRALDEAREALLQSQKLEALGQLTGGVAHDFNNLLMAIIGGLELVQRRLPNDPKVTPLVENAILAAQKGAALTQRMLAFARKQKLDRRPVAIPALFRGVIELLRPSLGPEIQIKTRFAADLSRALTDASQLETALINLLLNARDAMPDGGTITIEAQGASVDPADGRVAPGRYVRLMVKDTGCGMDAQTLARAVEPFFTTKGVGCGTGLGLSMVHGLAEQSGGRLVLTSRIGEGAAVELWLPEAPDDIRTRATAAIKTPRTRHRRASPLTILAVDDNVLVLMNLAAMLEDLGHLVLTASSASEALAALASGKPDLVVTDYAMPGINGLQLAEAIHEHRPETRVILATGYDETPGAGAGLLRLSKPFLQSDLAQAIRMAEADRPTKDSPLRAAYRAQTSEIGPLG
jgi:PAS domain S-box-containing protein